MSRSRASSEKTGMAAAEVRKRLEDSSPQKRLYTADEVAALVLFLCGDDASRHQRAGPEHRRRDGRGLVTARRSPREPAIRCGAPRLQPRHEGQRATLCSSPARSAGTVTGRWCRAISSRSSRRPSTTCSTVVCEAAGGAPDSVGAARPLRHGQARVPGRLQKEVGAALPRAHGHALSGHGPGGGEVAAGGRREGGDRGDGGPVRASIRTPARDVGRRAPPRGLGAPAEGARPDPARGCAGACPRT